MAQLIKLNLDDNKIGDSGVKALADAVSSVASAETVAPRLPGWTKLWTWTNSARALDKLTVCLRPTLFLSACLETWASALS